MARQTVTTKQSIYSAMSDANGLLAWAREYVRSNDLEQARVQVEAANVAVLLAKVRIAKRQEEEE